MSLSQTKTMPSTACSTPGTPSMTIRDYYRKTRVETDHRDDEKALPLASSLARAAGARIVLVSVPHVPGSQLAGAAAPATARGLAAQPISPGSCYATA